MKKTILIVTFLVLVLSLAACGGSSSTTSGAAAAGSDSSATTVPQTTPVPGQAAGTPAVLGQMPDTMKLGYGMFVLEDSQTPIDAAQAGQLLPLWKAARSLSASDTAAAAEIEALFKQIRNALTTEQQAALDQMSFSPEDFSAIAEKYGFTLGFGPGGGQMDETVRATMEALRASGQLPARGQGGGEFGPPAEGMLLGGPGGGGFTGGDPAAMQTAQAGGSTPRGARLGLNSALLDAIITFLESKAQ
jgi:predicted small secreted protein